MAKVLQLSPKTSVKLLVGNKSDMNYIKVRQADIDSLAQEAGMEYVEVSAKQAFNVDELFGKIEQGVASKLASGEIKPDSAVGSA